MKDTADDKTLDMFEKEPEKVKKVSKPTIAERQARVELLYGSPDTSENKTKRAELRASELPDWRTNGEKAAASPPEKAPSRPVSGGSGGSGSMGTGKMNRDISKNMKKGGKVAGRLATRGYGIAKK